MKKEPIKVDPNSKIFLQVIGIEEEREILSGTTGDGSACFIQSGEVRQWLIVDVPGNTSLAFRIEVPQALYEAVINAMAAELPEQV